MSRSGDCLTRTALAAASCSLMAGSLSSLWRLAACWESSATDLVSGQLTGSISGGFAAPFQSPHPFHQFRLVGRLSHKGKIVLGHVDFLHEKVDVHHVCQDEQPVRITAGYDNDDAETW